MKEKTYRYLSQTIADMREGLEEREKKIAALRSEVSKLRVEVITLSLELKRQKAFSVESLIPIGDMELDRITKEGSLFTQ